jgi:hypothetical protein
MQRTRYFWQQYRDSYSKVDTMYYSVPRIRKLQSTGLVSEKMAVLASKQISPRRRERIAATVTA